MRASPPVMRLTSAICECRIYLHRHRQLMPGAIVDDATLSRDVDGALLLVLRALFEVAVSKDLQIDEAEANERAPAQQNPA